MRGNLKFLIVLLAESSYPAVLYELVAVFGRRLGISGTTQIQLPIPRDRPPG
jgi:hypothetical protein